jgi:hypothetical protein
MSPSLSCYDPTTAQSTLPGPSLPLHIIPLRLLFMTDNLFPVNPVVSQYDLTRRAEVSISDAWPSPDCSLSYVY